MPETGRELILKDLIKPIFKKYDVILIDYTSLFGLLTLNALTACERVIIPMQCQFLAIQGLTKLTEIINRVKQRLNRKIIISGILLTHYDKRWVLDNEVVQAIEKTFKR